MSKEMCCSVDKNWEAECDARTLIKAQVILKDPKKKEAAIKAMEKMKGEKEKEMKMMEELIGA